MGDRVIKLIQIRNKTTSLEFEKKCKKIEAESTTLESEILNLVVKGMEDNEIAKILSLEENKVKETIQTLKQKNQTNKKNRPCNICP